MEKYILERAHYHKLLNCPTDNLIKGHNHTYIMSKKNNVITYNFDISLEDNLTILHNMDKNDNTFCQDCIDIKGCYGLVKEVNKTNYKIDNWD